MDFINASADEAERASASSWGIRSGDFGCVIVTGIF